MLTGNADLNARAHIERRRRRHLHPYHPKKNRARLYAVPPDVCDMDHPILEDRRDRPADPRPDRLPQRIP